MTLIKFDTEYGYSFNMASGIFWPGKMYGFRRIEHNLSGEY